MTPLYLFAQGLGIVGLVVIVLSFQCKKNRNFFLAQGAGSLLFFGNFILIGAYGGAFFNLTNLLRGLLLSKNPTKKWKLILIEAAYTGCFVFSVIMSPTLPQILLVLAPFSALVVMTVLMVRAKPVPIRTFQIAWMSPSWIIHNIFNFSLGGLICETLNMVSSAIFLWRLQKEKK